MLTRPSLPWPLPLIQPFQDLRNHGESPHDPSHDYTALAEDVEGFLQEHKIERAALIGHSMYVMHDHRTRKGC